MDLKASLQNTFCLYARGSWDSLPSNSKGHSQHLTNTLGKTIQCLKQDILTCQWATDGNITIRVEKK